MKGGKQERWGEGREEPDINKIVFNSFQICFITSGFYLEVISLGGWL